MSLMERWYLTLGCHFKGEKIKFELKRSCMNYLEKADLYLFVPEIYIQEYCCFFFSYMLFCLNISYVVDNLVSCGYHLSFTVCDLRYIYMIACCFFLFISFIHLFSFLSIFRWEERRTASGRVHYVNHMTRTTQWERPTRWQLLITPKSSLLL